MKKYTTKILIFILIFTITFIYAIKWIDKVNLKVDNETLDILIENSENTSIKRKLVSKLISGIKKTELINPVSLIVNNYEVKEKPVVKELSNDNKLIVNISPPIVYIYNTHDQEKYASSKEINLKYSVVDGSHYLQKKLKSMDIESIVETGSIKDILDQNNWNYASSYRVSRMYLEKRKKENKTLKYFIDLHRDSVKKNITTIEINGKKYARVMLLLGLENPNYKENEKNILKLENWLEKNYKGISRGIYRKKGKGVNGVYNQDFSDNCFLIEIGGEENTYEEVENTLDIIAQMLNDYIGDNND